MSKSLNRDLLVEIRGELEKYNNNTKQPTYYKKVRQSSITSIKSVNSRRVETNKKLNDQLDIVSKMIK